MTPWLSCQRANFVQNSEIEILIQELEVKHYLFSMFLLFFLEAQTQDKYGKN